MSHDPRRFFLDGWWGVCDDACVNRNRTIIMTLAPLTIMLSACMPHRMSTPSSQGGCAIIFTADHRPANADYHRNAWNDATTHEIIGYSIEEDDIIWNHRSCI